MRHGHGMMRRLEDEKPPDLDYFKLIRKISPLLWPEELNLKARVFLCAATLIVARFANIMVPQYYKGAVDKLSGSGDKPVGVLLYFMSLVFASYPLAYSVFPTYYIVMFAIMKVLQSINRDLRQFFWIDVEQVMYFRGIFYFCACSLIKVIRGRTRAKGSNSVFSRICTLSP